jgi:hypothetical protein
MKVFLKIMAALVAIGVAGIIAVAIVKECSNGKKAEIPVDILVYINNEDFIMKYWNDYSYFKIPFDGLVNVNAKGEFNRFIIHGLLRDIELLWAEGWVADNYGFSRMLPQTVHKVGFNTPGISFDLRVHNHSDTPVPNGYSAPVTDGYEVRVTTNDPRSPDYHGELFIYFRTK